MRLGALVRYRQTASRLACLPALAVLAVPLVAARYAPEARMVVECGALFMVCLVQTVRPTLLGWAIVLVWFARPQKSGGGDGSAEAAAGAH